MNLIKMGVDINQQLNNKKPAIKAGIFLYIGDVE